MKCKRCNFETYDEFIMCKHYIEKHPFNHWEECLTNSSNDSSGGIYNGSWGF